MHLCNEIMNAMLVSKFSEHNKYKFQKVFDFSDFQKFEKSWDVTGMREMMRQSCGEEASCDIAKGGGGGVRARSPGFFLAAVVVGVVLDRTAAPVRGMAGVRLAAAPRGSAGRARVRRWRCVHFALAGTVLEQLLGHAQGGGRGRLSVASLGLSALGLVRRTRWRWRRCR